MFYYGLARTLQVHNSGIDTGKPLALSMLTGLMSSSFVERVNSAAKDVMTHCRTSMADDLLELSTLLRVNKTFIEQCRDIFPEYFTEDVLLPPPPPPMGPAAGEPQLQKVKVERQ
eukprot:gene26858-7094_t